MKLSGHLTNTTLASYSLSPVATFYPPSRVHNYPFSSVATQPRSYVAMYLHSPVAKQLRSYVALQFRSHVAKTRCLPPKASPCSALTEKGANTNHKSGSPDADLQTWERNVGRQSDEQEQRWLFKSKSACKNGLSPMPISDNEPNNASKKGSSAHKRL